MSTQVKSVIAITLWTGMFAIYTLLQTVPPMFLGLLSAGVSAYGLLWLTLWLVAGAPDLGGKK